MKFIVFNKSTKLIKTYNLADIENFTFTYVQNIYFYYKY